MIEKDVLSLTHRHLLILNEPYAHLILEEVTKTKSNEINMVTYSIHTSHGLQLQSLDVVYFKPLKVAYKAYKNAWCVKSQEERMKKDNLIF